MKDKLFNAEKVAWLAERFDGFIDVQRFEQNVMARLPELELKARIDWIAECLVTHLDPDFEVAAQQVCAALPPPLDPALHDNDFGDFIIAPLGEWAVKAGLETHPERALTLLEDLTQRFTMEWAIRPFLNRWPDLTWSYLERWATHENYHVRRLVSEGTRPRLPWGIGVSIAPGATLPLLELLHADAARFVTRSVANHLNDIAKHDPDSVVGTLSHWARLGAQAEGELAWISRHALRGAVKAGYPAALRHLGYRDDLPLQAEVRVQTTDVKIGTSLNFTCSITAQVNAPVLVDYVLEFYRPSGRLGRKVFKLKQSRIPNSGVLDLSKMHPLKCNATTFKLYPGPHRIILQVNGQACAKADFALMN